MGKSQSKGNGVPPRACDYKKPEFICKQKYSTVVQLPDDPHSKLDIVVEMEDKGFKKNCAEPIGNAIKKENKFLSIEGPSLSSTCVISGIKKADYEREIGYIQTTKKFFEIQFEKAIFYSDFQSNVLHKQEEVLDCDGENKPFHSKESSRKISAGEEFLSNKKITLKLIHSATCDGELNHDWGNPQQLEKYQQFFVYLVMRSRSGDGEWEYDVLYSFEWFIYLKWIGETQTKENIFDYDYRIKNEKKGGDLPKFNENYTCKDDEFIYWIDTEKHPEELNIYRYPNSIDKKPLNKTEKIYKDINTKVSELRIILKGLIIKNLEVNKICEETKIMVSELADLCENNKNTNLGMLNCACLGVKEMTNFNDTNQLYSGENTMSNDTNQLSSEENTMSNDTNQLYSGENTMSNATNQLSLKENKICEEIKSCFSELIKLLHEKVSSDDMFCKNIERMDITKKIFREEIQKAVIKKNLANKQDKQSISNNNQIDQFEQTFDNA